MSLTQKELLKTIADWFDELGIDYMVTGAWSVIYYGRVRISHDVDFVVELSQVQVNLLEQKVKQGGNDFLLQPGVASEAVSEKGMFTMLYLPTMDKIDFWILKKTDFDVEKFKRRVKVQAWGKTIWVTSPEDAILQKLRWYKKGYIEKHIVDAAFVWQLQENLDDGYVNKWAEELGVTHLLARLDEINLEDYY